MSDSVRPHRRQPTRLPRPWDSAGTNTGVGCHFLLQCMKVKSESEVTQSCPTPCDPMDCMQPTRPLHPWDFPGKSTGVACHCLLHYLYKHLPNYFSTQLNHFVFASNCKMPPMLTNPLVLSVFLILAVLMSVYKVISPSGFDLYFSND